jgi:hypothetical protein
MGISFWVKHRESAFELGAPGGEISGKPVGVAIEANGCAGFGRARPRRDLTQHELISRVGSNSPLTKPFAQRPKRTEKRSDGSSIPAVSSRARAKAALVSGAL